MEDRLDEEGRLTIRPDLRERLGDRFVQILRPDGVLLRPVKGELEARPGLDALTASGEEEAMREAGR